MPDFNVTLTSILAALLLTTAQQSSAQEAIASPTAPPGAQKAAKTKALETGAKLLQSNSPVTGFNVYMVGFHPMKAQPEKQMTSHHYCHQMNKDFAQCMLFDGNTKKANMHGVEYIISEKLFESLPPEEKKYWHPHNGEILSGQLQAPGIPKAAEKSLMKTKINSYGKTWHVWNTGHHGHPNDALPFGEPMLAWSFNRDGEVQPGLVEQRDQSMHLDTPATRRERADLTPLARPQAGVDALKGQFARPTTDIKGVTEK